MSPVISPPSLQEATSTSTTTWQNHLENLFHQAKERFPDVVWELNDGVNVDEVWGHKAIVYARAPPSFQSRYFSFRPNPAPSPLPYSAQGSYLSLDGVDREYPRTPSPASAAARATSPSPSTNGGILRIQTAINPTLFSNELEYLYTGQGFGEAFEFLFDATENADGEEIDPQELRIDKLRKDLVFMWRSRLYSDIKIALTGTFSSTNHETSTAVFSTHRFILVSRCPYFYNALLNWPKHAGTQTLTLPSPPFTPASLHFTLGFIYTGTLIFSNRSYDLDTAFAIMRSATYLSLQTLYDEIQARIVQEMMHGLFHAFLEFSEYERLTGGRWGTGGCRCRQCARRAPRVLQFAIADDVKNQHLDRGARRALVGLFGEGWLTTEFALLPQKLRENLLKGVGKRTTPQNVFALLFAVEHALGKAKSMIDAWVDIVREMLLAGRKVIDELLCEKGEACFAQREWMEMMENDGVGFNDTERVDWTMNAVIRGLSDRTAAMVYQVLVSNILLLPHHTEPNAAMLSHTSAIRQRVEHTRLDVLRFIRKRWLGIRQEGGFDDLEGWALKEISDNIEVPLEDLLLPVNQAKSPTPYSHGNRLTVRNSTRDNESFNDSISMHSSMRVSVLSKQVTGKRSITPTSAAASVRSGVSRTTTTTTTTAARRRMVSAGKEKDERPDSKLTPSEAAPSRPSSSASSAMDVDGPDESGEQETHTTPSAPLPKKLVTASSASSISTAASRVTRPRPSNASVKSTTSISTLRKVRSPSATTATSRPALSTARSASRVSSASRASTSTTSTRPLSRVSTASTSTTGDTAYKTAPTAPTAGTRSRRTSVASSTSTATTATTRSRRPSGGSTTSPRAAAKKPAVPPVPALDSSKSTPSPRKPSSSSVAPSVRSSVSNVRRAGAASTPAGKPAPEKKVLSSSTSVKSLVKSIEEGAAAGAGQTSSSITIKPTKSTKPTAAQQVVEAHRKSGSGASAATLKRRGSTDTIGTIKKPIQPASPQPRGATLEIGIPCIISSKRKRFKAFARYIGEVEGEVGPWVGVEVPIPSGVGDATSPEPGAIGGRQWNDGTWGGIRYFELGGHGGGSEWDYYGDDSMSRAARRRRLDASGSSWTTRGAKREAGDHLGVHAKRMRSVSPAPSDSSCGETRGLFVRPQQVLYVVDAVGVDL
ncbi:hypothetical protein EV714DRAFT_245112 [Schizophyllum commune]